MNKKLIAKSVAVTAGLATVISLAAVSPSLAKGGHGRGGDSHSNSQQFSANDNSNVNTAALNFTVTNVPAIYSDAAQLGKVVLFKIVPLAADATEAPATPPALTGEGNKRKGKARNLASFHSENAPVLANGTLSGSILIKAAAAAGVSNFAIYPIVRADASTGLAAQTGTPVFVVRTTSADLTVTLTQSVPLTIDLAQNTGTIKAAQTATVTVPDDGKTYQLEISNSDGKRIKIVAVTGVGTVTVNLPRLKPGSYALDLVAKTASTGFTINDDGTLGGAINIG